MNAAQAQEGGVLESVLRPSGPVPVASLPADVVAELERLGLLVRSDEEVAPSPAAEHFWELLEDR